MNSITSTSQLAPLTKLPPVTSLSTKIPFTGFFSVCGRCCPPLSGRSIAVTIALMTVATALFLRAIYGNYQEAQARRALIAEADSLIAKVATTLTSTQEAIDPLTLLTDCYTFLEKVKNKYKDHDFSFMPGREDTTNMQANTAKSILKDPLQSAISETARFLRT